MAEPFLGEIRPFPGNFVPVGWLPCDGRLLPIAGNIPLFALLGTTYGGDGNMTFAIPDLQGRAAVHQGQGPGLTNRTIGSTGGSETVTLDVTQIPAHSHTPGCTSLGGTQTTAAGAVWARQPSGVTAAYQSAAPDTDMSGAAAAADGSGSPHNNMQPFVAITYMIAVEGVFPSQG